LFEIYLHLDGIQTFLPLTLALIQTWKRMLNSCIKFPMMCECFELLLHLCIVGSNSRFIQFEGWSLDIANSKTQQ